VRIYPRLRTDARWSTSRVNELLERLGSDRYRVRPNHVCLADGVARHFGIVGASGPGGTPGVGGVADAALVSTAEPSLAPAHLPARLGLRGHRRPNVVVLDSGLRTRRGRPEHPELRMCAIHHPWRVGPDIGRWDDEDQPDDDGGARLDHQAGHGTFISGIIRQLCPDAVIHHDGVLSSYGDGDQASVTNSVSRVLERLAAEPIDVVVMSFGTYGTAGEAPPMAAEVARLRERGAVVVAAAGNDGTSRPYFPAALDGVVAAGALDTPGRAVFSNFGPWVDACAPAVDVVSTFFTSFDERDHDGAVLSRYRGWARWSGTSFAAPKIAGLIAQDLYLHEGTADEAWQRIAAGAPHRHPTLGRVFNV
jgi:subtilisin family serine protease